MSQHTRSLLHQVTASTFLVMAMLSMSTTVAQTVSQKADRFLEKRSDFYPPVEIVMAKTKKGGLKINQKFIGDDEWLKGLTLSVSNNSGNTVTSMIIDLHFPRFEDQNQKLPRIYQLPFTEEIWFGQNPFSEQDVLLSNQPEPIRPGEVREIALSDIQYNNLKETLKKLEFPTSIKSIEVRVSTIGFSDGTVWFGGQIFHRDPNNSGKWILSLTTESHEEQTVTAISSATAPK